MAFFSWLQGWAVFEASEMAHDGFIPEITTDAADQPMVNMLASIDSCRLVVLEPLAFSMLSAASGQGRLGTRGACLGYVLRHGFHHQHGQGKTLKKTFYIRK